MSADGYKQHSAAGREKYNFNSGWKLKVGDIAQAALRLFFQIQILISVE